MWDPGQGDRGQGVCEQMIRAWANGWEEQCTEGQIQVTGRILN